MCPCCEEYIEHRLHDRAARVLASAGVPIRLRPVRFDHPPITRDELLDFHTLLQDDTVLQKVVDRLDR